MDAVTIEAARYSVDGRGAGRLTMDTDRGTLHFHLPTVNRLLVRDGWAPLWDPVPEAFADRSISPKPGTELVADATDSEPVVALLWKTLRQHDRGEIKPGPIGI